MIWWTILLAFGVYQDMNCTLFVAIFFSHHFTRLHHPRDLLLDMCNFISKTRLLIAPSIHLWAKPFPYFPIKYPNCTAMQNLFSYWKRVTICIRSLLIMCRCFVCTIIAGQVLWQAQVCHDNRQRVPGFGFSAIFKTACWYVSTYPSVRSCRCRPLWIGNYARLQVWFHGTELFGFARSSFKMAWRQYTRFASTSAWNMVTIECCRCEKGTRITRIATFFIHQSSQGMLLLVYS